MKQDADKSEGTAARAQDSKAQCVLIALLAVVMLAVAAALIWQSTARGHARGDARSHGDARAHRGT